MFSQVKGREIKGVMPQLNLELLHNIELTPIKKMYDTVSFSFIGDVMVHGNQLKAAYIDSLDIDGYESYDFSSYFKYTRRFFEKADIVGANMEFPNAGAPFKGYPIFSAPESIIKEAQKSGINLFMLANNHLFDMGVKGFDRTLNIYKDYGAEYIGAYLSAKEQEENNPYIITLRGVKIGIINFTYGTNVRYSSPYKLNMMDSVYVKSRIAKAKESGCDFIVALPHWGAEYQFNPSKKQKAWANMLFREGVRSIIGSHPHVIQKGEIHYDREGDVDRFIYYSLGNYISNQSNPDYTQLELLVEFSIVKDNFTGEVEILAPKHHYLWCFKGGEFESNYTTIPVEEIIGKEELIKDEEQYYRMLNAYQSFIEKNLIKEYR